MWWEYYRFLEKLLWHQILGFWVLLRGSWVYLYNVLPFNLQSCFSTLRAGSQTAPINSSPYFSNWRQDAVVVSCYVDFSVSVWQVNLMFTQSLSLWRTLFIYQLMWVRWIIQLPSYHLWPQLFSSVATGWPRDHFRFAMRIYTCVEGIFKQDRCSWLHDRLGTKNMRLH